MLAQILVLQVGFFSNQFPKAEIIAIEPDSENYEILIKNTEYNKNIQCLKGGTMVVRHKSFYCK